MPTHGGSDVPAKLAAPARSGPSLQQLNDLAPAWNRPAPKQISISVIIEEIVNAYVINCQVLYIVRLRVQSADSLSPRWSRTSDDQSGESLRLAPTYEQ